MQESSCLQKINQIPALFQTQPVLNKDITTYYGMIVPIYVSYFYSLN